MAASLVGLETSMTQPAQAANLVWMSIATLALMQELLVLAQNVRLDSTLILPPQHALLVLIVTALLVLQLLQEPAQNACRATLMMPTHAPNVMMTSVMNVELI